MICQHCINLIRRIAICFNKVRLLYKENLRFIRSRLDGAKIPIILSDAQAIYFVELDPASSFGGPRLTEDVLVSDYNKSLKKFLK